MSTLTTEPVAPLLERLFSEADAASPATDPAMADLLKDHDRLLRSKTEYAEFYGRLKDYPLAVSRETGILLYTLARSTKAKTIIEFGTSFGISTIHLAAALRDNGGGQLITTEFEPSKVERAQENLVTSTLIELVEFRVGDALQTLSADLPETINLVLLDGAKALYNDILDLLEPHLHPGSLLIADNADFSPDYLARVRTPTNGYLSVPFGEDVELSVRLV